MKVDKYELDELLFLQLKSNFGLSLTEQLIIEECIIKSLKRTEYCFKHSKNKYYNINGETIFNIFHSAQYCIFLYFLSNTIYQSVSKNKVICEKIYLLNKLLNGLDLFYEVELPDIFFTDHPVGAVIGRGKFSNHFSFTQSCTVGNNNGKYPIIGEGVKMLGHSSILGSSKISRNVFIAPYTCVIDQDIPENCLVFGKSPKLKIVKKKPEYFKKLYGR